MYTLADRLLGRHVPNWKPVVLQTWYLVTMIILTIAMMVAVGYLYYLSDKHIIRKEPGKKGGGLFAYTDINKLSVLEFAIWKYFPTLVGVIYGILWKVTDEELKRSEPYYQLSKGSTGALAAESLLCHKVPPTGCRGRRHRVIPRVQRCPCVPLCIHPR
jgi:hypothetical protein